MSEVRRDAGFRDARHVTHGCQATAGGRQERQHWEAPPLPIQPPNDTSRQSLSCGHAHPVQQSQRITEEVAVGHVPLLQTHLCRERQRERERERETERERKREREEIGRAAGRERV